MWLFFVEISSSGSYSRAFHYDVLVVNSVSQIIPLLYQSNELATLRLQHVGTEELQLIRSLGKGGLRMRVRIDYFLSWCGYTTGSLGPNYARTMCLL